MTRDEVKELVVEIKGAFPSLRYDDPTTTVNVWWKVFEDERWTLEDAKAALYKYLDRSEKQTPPQPGQLKAMIVGANKSKEIEGCTMVFDRKSSCVIWKPEKGSQAEYIPVWFDHSRTLRDAEGRMYADPNWQ